MGIFHKFAALLRDFQQSVVIDVLTDIARNDGLSDGRIPDSRRFVLARAELFELVVFVRGDVVGEVTADEIDDMVLSEVLFQHVDGIQHDLQSHHCLAFLLRMQAVVAILAVVLVVAFAEIVEQHFPSADARLGVGGGFLQQLPANVLLCDGFSLHKLLEFLQVFIGIESDAVALAAVASGTSSLLIIAFERLGDVVVDNEAHVGLVDAHSEGDGGDDDVDALHQEVVLRFGTTLRVESSVVGSGLDVVGLKHSGEFLDFLAR